MCIRDRHIPHTVGGLQYVLDILPGLILTLFFPYQYGLACYCCQRCAQLSLIHIFIDELHTIYCKGLDDLIATARSNKVAVCLGFQDFSHLVRDYGDKAVSYTHLDVYKRQSSAESR